MRRLRVLYVPGHIFCTNTSAVIRPIEWLILSFSSGGIRRPCLFYVPFYKYSNTWYVYM